MVGGGVLGFNRANGCNVVRVIFILLLHHTIFNLFSVITYNVFITISYNDSIRSSDPISLKVFEKVKA